MNGKNCNYVDYELKDIVICALRYALPRHTYILDEVCSYIKEHTELLDRRVVVVMLRDIDECLENYEIAHSNLGRAIWGMDKNTIEDLRRFLIDYGNERNETD